MTDGVDEDLYSSNESPPNKPKSAKPDSVDEQNEEEATDLISKDSFPGGCKVGDKYEVEITGDHGDQFSVKVVGDEDKKEPDKGPEPAGDDMEEINRNY